MTQNEVYRDLDEISASLFRNFLTKTFATMGLGLIVSGIVAFLTYQNIISGGFIYQTLISYGRMPLFAIVAVQFIVVIAISSGLYKFSPAVARMLFFLYCCLTGLTLSTLLISFALENIVYAFFFASVMFISCAVIGHTTKMDLSKISGLLTIGLFTLIVVSIVSIFIDLSAFELFISYFGVIIFLGLTAWDTQKLKVLYYENAHDDQLLSKMSIYGALMLYLDFINLFIYILRILGRKRR